MDENITALLLHGEEDSLSALRTALEKQTIRIVTVPTCKAAWSWLNGPNTPHLLFSRVALPDGNWADVLELAAQAPEPVSVVVVSAVADVALYMEVMERGSFDFITLSFTPFEIAYVIRSAVESAIGRRKAKANVRSLSGVQ